MFSSGIINKNYVIGNLPIGREKYVEIKEAILEQIKDYLTSDKEIFDLIDIVNEMEEANIDIKV